MASEAQSESLADELVEAKLIRPLEVEEVVETKSSLKKANKKASNKVEDEMEKKMAAFREKKASIPSPEVRHEKGNNFDQDINLPIDIIVGGNHLMEDTTLKLTMGTRYGLVGRNGIGKTCLIDAISLGEIEGWPGDIHSLQVEQEIDGDDFTVLEHILACDVERTALLKEMEEIVNSADEPAKVSGGNKKGGKGGKGKKSGGASESTMRLSEISERLETICAND